MKKSSREHFNTVAEEYDHWKEKNWYYYENLKNLFRSLVPAKARVLEIGCGTGQILGSLDVSSGHGIDISEGMIAIARHNFYNRPNLKFEVGNVLESSELFDYDFVLIPDVIGHIENLEEFMGHIRKRMRPGIPLVITTANSMWKPVLEIAEKLKLKSPEGPHWWLSTKENERVFRESGLKISKKGYHLLIPKKIIGADWINKRVGKIPLISRLGLGVWWQLSK